MSKCAWVTGAGKGIGRATALRLAEIGWRVAISARTESDLLALNRTLPGCEFGIYPLDVRDEVATIQTVQKIEKEFGKIDLAIFNAGTYKPISIHNFSSEVFRDLVETNVMGTVFGLSAILPFFLKRKAGHIAIMGSVAGYRGLPTSAAYGCTKAGLINMAEALKLELEAAGIKLSLINPGFVDTPLTEKNDFKMPFLLSGPAAADLIVKGLNADKFEITFPLRFAMIMKVLRICPNWILFRMMRFMGKKQ